MDFALNVFICTGYQIGVYLLNKLRWNVRFVLIIGASLSLAGIFAASFMTNFWAFVFLYGVFSGLGCGMNYLVPMVCCWEHFPHRKGLMSGIMMGSYGLGSFMWTKLSTWIVNPNNDKPYDVGIKDLKYFHEDVAR